MIYIYIYILKHIHDKQAKVQPYPSLVLAVWRPSGPYIQSGTSLNFASTSEAASSPNDTMVCQPKGKCLRCYGCVQESKLWKWYRPNCIAAHIAVHAQILHMYKWYHQLCWEIGMWGTLYFCKIQLKVSQRQEYWFHTKTLLTLNIIFEHPKVTCLANEVSSNVFYFH